MEPTHNWARWPHPNATPSLELEEPTSKEASALSYSELSPGAILTTAASVLPEWIEEMPDGTEKTAALRFEDDGDLPAVTVQNIWRHPNAHPLVLTLMLLDKYGEDYVNWDPEALRLTLLKDNCKCSESVWTKILAARVLLTSPAPWRQWEQFHWISQGLAGKPPNFVYLEKPQIGFLMSAADSMRILDVTRSFGEDVTKYVATVFKDAGIAYCPTPLSFAQDELDDKHIECLDCGTVERDDNDVKCVACGSKRLKKIPGAFEALRDKTKAEYQARRRKPLAVAVDGLGDDATGESTYRLLVHAQYRNEVRSQMLQQLRMLRSK